MEPPFIAVDGSESSPAPTPSLLPLLEWILRPLLPHELLAFVTVI